MADKVKRDEQNHLDYIENKIKEAAKRAEEEAQNARKNLKIIQKDYYNDVRLRETTYSGLMTTSVEIRQKQQMMQQREQTLFFAKELSRLLKALAKRPYFARVDFKDSDGENHSIYIGLASFTDINDTDHYLIYDWRAPIASIYYANKMGKVSYHAPDGNESVEIVLKRQFYIQNGKIQTVFDTDQVVGDQMLIQNLAAHSTSKMKSIVTTIQNEQNKVIRDVKNDLLFVQGAAGSGKTSAALQRVAYLLYHYRNQINSKQIILFSPNQLFNDYISNVLPELGEHNMVQMTYDQYSNHRVPHLRVNNLSQRFAIDNSDQVHPIVNLKNQLQFFKMVTNYAESLNHHGMAFRNLIFAGKIFISKQKIHDIYYGFNDNYNLENRLAATKQALMKILDQRIKAEMKKEWVQRAINDLSKQQLDMLQATHPSEFANPDHEFKFLAKHIVAGGFRGIKREIEHELFLSINIQYIRMLKAIKQRENLHSFGISDHEWDKNIQKLMDRIQNGQIPMCDVSPYLYLFDKMVGKRGHNDIKYIFIDEVQDYTSFQIAFLKFEFPKAKFTMLGDLNQAIFTHQHSNHLFDDVKTLFDPEKVRMISLNKTYRSTKQISDFSKYLLSKDSKIESFARNGHLPLIQSTNSEHAVGLLKNWLDNDQNDHETTAIIGKDLPTCRKIYHDMKQSKMNVTLIQTENQRLVSGTLIVPAYFAKGLEFDSVIMWDASDKNYHKASDRQLVYTICTRAMHRLRVLSIGKISRLFDGIPKQLYELKR
ncbi:DNA helicase [Philodulcilactobacillus myokoensis]|uniref:DNA helicase n=1 Tax=Philodulcilactobacillus myokoensis TaxID=2929573 RepID=A0A9W6B082_9LACO|nr:RNA polymerase recycling motor HelD [Philodulcilactobacillus myokoensis]GLB46577.1 DNA helicase [Philodulcilactobacillus myokoensis]